MLQLACDVAVVGGDIAGATLARLLARSGLEVAVVEARTEPEMRLPEMLPPAALQLLVATDLVSLIEAAAGPAIACAGIRRKWGSGAPQMLDFMWVPGGRGFIVDRARLALQLRDAARSAGTVWFAGSAVGSVQPSESGFDLNLRGASSLRLSAARVVDATGRRAAVARHLEATLQRGTNRLALTFRLQVSPATAADAIFYVEGLSDAWCYAVNGPAGVLGVAVVAEAARVPRTTVQRRRWAAERIEAALVLPAWRTRVATEGTFFTQDATFSTLDRVAGPGWFAVGDAACAFDPMASQGLASALATCVAVHQIMIEGAGPAAPLAAAYQEKLRATWQNSRAGANDAYRTLYAV